MFKVLMGFLSVAAFYTSGFAQELNGGIVSEDPGMKLISYVGIVLWILTLALVIYKVTFMRRDRVIGTTTRWLFLIVFLILSPLVYFISFGIGIEKAKPVEFCNNCHVMNSHVDDMKDPDSESIAALHYKYRWISDDQCYTCHSDYGLYGAVGAKFAGVRHILNYYVTGYPNKLEIRGTYNNERCLFCHAPVEEYQEVEEHQKYAAEIKSSKQSCFGADCHVSPHPDDTKEIANNWRSK